MTFLLVVTGKYGLKDTIGKRQFSPQPPLRLCFLFPKEETVTSPQTPGKSTSSCKSEITPVVQHNSLNT